MPRATAASAIIPSSAADYLLVQVDLIDIHPSHMQRLITVAENKQFKTPHICLGLACDPAILQEHHSWQAVARQATDRSTWHDRCMSLE